ncbi:MAG: ABC transporter ATP-binding protein, partial [Thermodesulfobacteriota bacterium]|nr:ABC transporter ATP-binding protein [Thermodesulfobacteriota bacterium]
QNLSKQYHIGSQRSSYRTLRETLTDAFVAPVRRVTRLMRGQATGAADLQEAIWALKDISFDVKKGEVVGIIGRNGAGKSTLLKVLSRITEPTGGYAEVRGRVGSLLELKTGFHPELTGRENIYLNGVILGMKREDVNCKFDKIVSFSEVEKFIDTPLKHYSSGMYLRLAFAVAVHLESDILLVDEVLAVGDAAFQKKCLEKMEELAKEGRTVLFVSHNMPSVQRLCEEAYLFEQGCIITNGSAVDVVETYYKLTMDRKELMTETRNIPKGEVRFLNWQIKNSSVGDIYSCFTGEPCTIVLKLGVRRVVNNANFGIAIWTKEGTLAWAARYLDCGGESIFLQEGLYELEFSVLFLPLRPGTYQILISVNNSVDGTLDHWYAQPELQILPKNESGIPPRWQGILNLESQFNLTYINELNEKDDHL